MHGCFNIFFFLARPPAHLDRSMQLVELMVEIKELPHTHLSILSGAILFDSAVSRECQDKFSFYLLILDNSIDQIRWAMGSKSRSVQRSFMSGKSTITIQLITKPDNTHLSLVLGLRTCTR